MALNVTIGGNGELFVGEDKTFKLEVVDTSNADPALCLPVDIAGWTLVFDVRKKDNSADPAIFSKTPSLEGVYAATRAANTQRAVVTLTDTEMNTVSAKTYRHSWKRLDDGLETVLAWGDFVVQKATSP